MKIKFFGQVLTGIVIAFVAVVTIPEPLKAYSNRYYCAQLHGIYRTFVRTERGNIDLIKWVNQISEYWNPKRRCIEVSKRFQRFYDTDRLNYIATGIVNSQPVICAVARTADTCKKENVLLTLPSESDRHKVVQVLLDTRNKIKGAIIELDNRPFGTIINGEKYYDVNFIQESVKTEEEPLIPINK